MISKKHITEIKKLGINIDHEMSFGGKSKGNKHLFRVVKLAKHLAIKARADMSIVESGAWLHDTALPSGDDYNYRKNKQIVMGLLSAINIPLKDKNFITECVASHEGTEYPKTLEAQIVHDADVIEKLGLLGIIRHTWKMTNLGKINPKIIKDQDVKKILDHIQWRSKRLKIPIAKKIGKYLTISLSKKKAKNIISLTATLALNGVVTEKIAVILRKYLSQKQNERLREQLNLGYLHKFD